MKEPQSELDISKYVFSNSPDCRNTVLMVKGLSFSYDGKVEVLKSVDMSLGKGELTVLLGESGSGKSTLLKTIMGLYEPSEGNVVFTDEGAAPITKHSMTNKFAYVPQDAMLFNASIYENLTWGNKEISHGEVIAAAKAAGADEFIMQMPKGYDTMLQDDGKSLSGGQRQRLSIARALLKNTPILLLDEITSALDKENEEKILKTILKLKEEKAILLITHKTDLCEYADVVKTIKNGRIE